ncbi:MAG: putative Ig domain-containing protein [Clostridia bacterium]|nr:putative Ig domain-containing protein [Clostridia bacterium]
MNDVTRRILTVFLTLALILPFAASVTAEESAEMRVRIDIFNSEPVPALIAEGETISLGDTFTVRVSTTLNPGIHFGTLYFDVSDNVEPVSATYGGQPVEFTMASVEPSAGSSVEPGDPEYNYGNYGIMIIGDMICEETSDYASMTFRVTGLDIAEVSFYLFQAITEDGISVTLTPDSETYIQRRINAEKPSITTETLSAAVMGIEYSDALECDTDDEFVEWEIVGGALPGGLSLQSDGTITGTPTEYGEFSFDVCASILGRDDMSDTKTVTLTVYEKPQKLELVENSLFVIEDETAYLLNVVEKTTVADAVAQFENPSFIKAFNQNGTLLANTDIIGTGCTISLIDGETVMDTVTVIVLGDVDGNGEIGPTDYQRIRSYFLGNYIIEGPNLKAAHVSGSQDVGPTDYQRVRSHFLGNYDIYAH